MESNDNQSTRASVKAFN